MCYFKCQEQKNYQFSQFLPDLWFFLKFNMAFKMATIVGDVTDLQQRHHPLNIPHFFEKINGFPLKAKSFRNTATYQKTLGRGTINPHPPPPPLPPCITVGVWPCAYVREFQKKKHTQQEKTQTHPQTEQYVRTPQIKSERTTMVSAILRNTLFSYPCFPLTRRYLKTEIYYDWRFTQFTQLR